VSEEARGEQVRWVRVAAACGGVLAAALAAAIGLAATRPDPPRRDPPTPRQGVVVHEVVRRSLRPELEGLGRTRPRRRVAISAQVGGEVVEAHPELEDGAYLPAGAVAVRIDRADHEQEVARATALRDAAAAEERRLRAQVAHVASRVALARDILAENEAELRRIERLQTRGVGTQRELEAARQAVLRARDARIALETTAELLGPQIDAAAARVEEARARLARASLDLSRTEVRLPFAGRATAVAVEAHQLLSAGQVLFELWDVDRVELPVALGLDEAYLLSPDLRTVPGEAPGDEARTATVRWEGRGVVRTWHGVLRRFEPVDRDTQTVRAVVEVDNEEAERPLPAEVFCQVALQAPPVPAALAVPVAAVQERDRVYAVRDGRLAVLAPRLGRRIGGWVVVEEGLEAGELVVVSPLERAVEGVELVVTDRDEPEAAR